MPEQQLYRMIETDRFVPGQLERDATGAHVHWARSKYAPALYGWDMLYSKGLPRLVGEDETLPTCPRCEQKRHN